MVIGPKYWTDVVKLYVENDCPDGRMCRIGGALDGFTDELNRRLSSDFKPEDVSATLEYIRKSKSSTGGLPHLGRNYSGPRFMNPSDN